MAKIALSGADRAFDALDQLITSGSLLGADDPDLSETDTRSKLIDPLFRDILGWRETDIRREEPVATGFVDYSFGTEFKFFHVEAKRTSPRFRIHAAKQPRQLKLSGPHLLGNKDVKPVLEQAAKYSPELGTQFAPGRLHHKSGSEEDLGEVVVIPAGGEAFVFDAHFESAVVFQEA